MDKLEKGELVKDGLIKNGLLVTSGELASKSLGFARDMLIGGLFGASAQLDAFFVAYNVPGVFVAFLATSLTTAFVPVFFSFGAHEAKNEEDREREHFVANFASCSSLLFMLLSLVIYLCAPLLLTIMAPGFTPYQSEYGVRLIRVFSVCTLVAGLSLFLKTHAQCKKQFGWPALSDVVNNGLVLLLSWVLGRSLGIFGLAYAFIIGMLVQTTILLFPFFRGGSRFALRWSLREPGFARVFRLSLPLYVGMLTANVSIIIDRAMASSLTTGSISALTYADKIRSLPIMLLGTAVVTVLFPTIASLVAGNTKAEAAQSEEQSGQVLAALLARVFKITLIISAFVTKVFWLLSVPLVMVLLQRGSFTPQAGEMTAQALRFFALGIPAAIMGTILLRVCHANQDTVSPVIIGLISVSANIVLNLLLIGPLAHGGIALATSIANWVWFLLLTWQVEKRHKVAVFTTLQGFGDFSLKLLALNTVTGIAGWKLAQVLANQGLVTLVAVTTSLVVADLAGLRVLGLLPGLRHSVKA